MQFTTRAYNGFVAYFNSATASYVIYDASHEACGTMSLESDTTWTIRNAHGQTVKQAAIDPTQGLRCFVIWYRS